MPDGAIAVGARPRHITAGATLLLHLGLIGDEFKTARLHLTKRLAGSAAWKGERRDRGARTPQAAGGRADEPTEGEQAAE